MKPAHALIIMLLFLFMAAFALLYEQAHAAADYPCSLYAREALRGYVGTIPPADLPNLTVDQLTWTYTKYFSHCVLLDEVPEIKDMSSEDQFVANLWSQLQRDLPKPAPEAPHATEPAKPPPVASQAPLAKPAAATSQQAVCVRAKMRTLWSGKSWRCAK
jgi:hypothetical protein